MWLDAQCLTYGFLVPPISSAAQKKAFREHPYNKTTLIEIHRAMSVYRSISKEFTDEIENRKAALIEKYRAEKGFEKDLLELLRPEIRRSFSYLHDYRQFIARVRQNINVVLDRYPGDTIEQKLSRAFPSEKAIYASTILMEEKLQAAYLLLNPDRMLVTDETIFRVHGLVTKYLRIYQASFDEKNVRVKVVGESHGEVKGSQIASSVIPHTLIDNALKYAPRGSEVIVEFRETEDRIELSVSSYGPQIRNDEREKIFEIFFRSDAAVKQEEEGAGFGLYLAQFAAKQLGTAIVVKQQSKKDNSRGYWTTFSIAFTRER
ncbi:MAG TPA: sensor histidine kinase [Terriglobales bacterium]|nr:sensor histidine kinase [Terriglobales bacterium]